MKSIIAISLVLLSSLPATAVITKEDADQLIVRACQMKKDGIADMEIRQYLTDLMFSQAKRQDDRHYEMSKLAANMIAIVGVERWNKTKQCEKK